ncbi:MAG: ribosome maturation factor RimP [Elusimicrobiaceae bacterium]
MQDNSKLETSIGSMLHTNGYELVDLAVKRTGRKPLLQFFIDRLEGAVNVDDCARMSQKIEGVLDMEQFYPQGYIIEVSSPGVFRPLKKPEHYSRFMGERVKVILHEPLEGRAVFTGVIAGASEKSFTLSDGTSSFEFAFDRIKKANLDPVMEF